MTNLIGMSTQEIIARNQAYIDRLTKLAGKIDKFMGSTQNSEEERQEILASYKSIKNEIKEESNCICKANVWDKMLDKSNEHNSYAWGVREANAYGFTTKVNGKVDYGMFASVEEAISKLSW